MTVTSPSRARAPELLHYRPWHGSFRGPAAAVWPIARLALLQVWRRRLFWWLYGFGLLYFLLYFFGQYLLSWAQTQVDESEVRVGGLGRANPRDLIRLFRIFLKLDGSGETYRSFIAAQGSVVMVVLVLAGALLVGNDLRFGSLPYYLSKPLSRWHYLLGKGLAVAVLINLLTTVPALVLWVQYGLLESWDYLFDHANLAAGILGYGAVLTVTLSLMLLASATWLRRTVPLAVLWTALFFFCRVLAVLLVNGLHFDARWRLIDLWNDLLIVGNACMSLDPLRLRPQPQPAWFEAAGVLGGVSLACLTYLVLRIRAVEIVR